MSRTACHQSMRDYRTTAAYLYGCGTCGGDRDYPTNAPAQPRRGTVRDSYGDPCPRSSGESYPLTARCDHCSADIRCASGDADWVHARTRRIVCG